MIDVASQSTRAWTASRASRVVSGVSVVATLRPDSLAVSSFGHGGTGNGKREENKRRFARFSTARQIALHGRREPAREDRMSEPRRSTTRAAAPTRNVRTRDGATHPRTRPQPAPQPRREEVSRDVSGDGAQPDAAATPTFTEVTPRAVKYASVVAFLAWTFAVYDYISFGTLLPKIAESFHWSTSFATAVA